ncbi:unnamed protein product [Ixodes pacificus]
MLFVFFTAEIARVVKCVHPGLPLGCVNRCSSLLCKKRNPDFACSRRLCRAVHSGATMCSWTHVEIDVRSSPAQALTKQKKKFGGQVKIYTGTPQIHGPFAMHSLWRCQIQPLKRLYNETFKGRPHVCVQFVPT